MASVGPYVHKRDAVRVKVTKYDGHHTAENRKFSVDPQITSFDVLNSLLAKAFEIRGEFTVCCKFLDDYGEETYLALLSDWDLDAAFLRASEPYLDLRVDCKAVTKSAAAEDEWEAATQGQEVAGQVSDPIYEIRHAHKLPGILMNKMGRTLNSVVQRAFNLAEEHGHVLYNSANQLQQPQVSSVPPRPPLTDAEFRQYLDPIGQVIKAKELRSVIYLGGIEPSLRKVVWKHLLNVYPEGMSGKERMDYMKMKAAEYRKLRDSWKEMYKNEQMIGDLAYVTSMVKKDVLRTDRHHQFYAGSDDNKNIASLFNILTTYALNHPCVSYCQGMSDLASPLLVTMDDEAHAYICFCGLMQRLAPNFLLDGITMTKRFQHLSEGLMYYDPHFYNYLKLHQADDLLFCYRWLLLEMKREFAFDEALRMLEVMWSSVVPLPPEKELPLFQKEFCASPVPISPRPRETPYTKICALRRQNSSASLSLDGALSARGKGRGRLARQRKTRPYNSMDESQLTVRSNTVNPDTSPVNDKSSARVVKNLNEFLSFDKSNALRIGRKIINSVDESTSVNDKMKNIEEENSQNLKHTAINMKKDFKLFRDNKGDRDGEIEMTERRNYKKHPLDDSSDENEDGNGSSPNDSSSDFFPSMTTSMTNELRLELESLDRQVFLSNDAEKSSQSDNNSCGNNMPDDVFIWENPLRNTSSSSRRSTPDEQCDLDYDINTNLSSSSSSTASDDFNRTELKSSSSSLKSSVSSIKSIRKTISSDYYNTSKNSTFYVNSIIDNTSSGSTCHSSSTTKDQSKSLLERRKGKLDGLITNNTIVINSECSSNPNNSSYTATNGNISINNSSSNSNNRLSTSSTSTTSSNNSVLELPPPDEFGSSNPFLMFLCVTVLQQHRDFIIKSGMDYNEMAMHFDKMVRKHDVTKVLNQARMMFADYMRRHNSNVSHLII